MKKAMFRNEANKLTIIENVFVVLMFALIISFSIPSLNTAIRELFVSTFHIESTDYTNESKGILGWIPPQLFLNDNKAIYCCKDIELSEEAKIIGNAASNLGNEFRFPFPVFPRFPYGTIPAKGNITPEDASRPLLLSKNGYFENITINSSIFITTGNKGDSREIIVDNLDLGSSGKIILIGKGLLKLYVRTNLNLSGSSSINSDGSPDSLVVYYQGKDPLSMKEGTQVFVGSIFAETSDFIVSGGKPTIKGSIILGGTSVSIENTSFQGRQFLLYAPEANVHISGDSDIEGKLIVKQLIGSGNSIIRYLPVSINNTFRWKD